MAKRDYYEALGVSKNATKDQIKKAYRQLAKQYHPDRNKESGADAKFKEAQEAYDVLSDAQKRAAYDQYGFAGTQAFDGGLGGQGGYGGMDGFDFGNLGDLTDLFGSFFGSNFSGFAESNGGGRQRGQDIQAGLKLTFQEAVFGAEKTLKYERYEECDVCHGTGAEGGKTKTCTQCAGKGKVAQIRNTMFGAMQTVAVCPTCSGTGQEIEHKCKNCKGEGRVMQRSELTLKIPAGIPDGVTLRFQGKGDAGKHTAGHGDLFVNIEVEAHPRLERRRDDIYLNQDIDAVTATLGGEVTVPSVDGDITIKIPAGSQPGAVLKLSGKAGPKFGNTGRGDQYVKLNVQIPQKLTRAQQQAWEQLRLTQ